jgi:hypothetical protein
MTANAVDVASPAIERRRACDVDDGTDLGERLVTIGVGALPDEGVAAALANGAALAERLAEAGLIWGAVLALQGRCRVAGGARAGERAGVRCIFPRNNDH